MTDYRQDFLHFAISRKAIRFGQFKTKAGRLSPYFFNAALFSDGASLAKLTRFYAKAILSVGVSFDMLFGPAYKGIMLASGVAIALSERGIDVPFAFNRKEPKDHGEGGSLIGAALAGRVLIVDDVVSAGTSIREAVELLRAHAATPAGVMIALDRMERGLASKLSAAQEVKREFGISVFSIATLDDLVSYLRARPELAHELDEVTQYRALYGAQATPASPLS